MSRVSVIQWFIDFLNAETYLEIGVRNGDSFLPIVCKNKIAVDIDLSAIPESAGELFEMSSDEYFSNNPSKFDVAFVDGDHTYEQSLRDVENCLKWMKPNGVILLHDCNPNTAELTAPEFGATADWCGEVWKTILTLRTDRNLSVFVMDTDYGIGIVMKKGQTPLQYTREQIKAMTYKDLEENRKEFLKLVEYA